MSIPEGCVDYWSVQLEGAFLYIGAASVPAQWEDTAVIWTNETVVKEQFLGQLNWHIPGSYMYLPYNIWVSLRAKSGWPSVGLAVEIEKPEGHNRTVSNNAV